MTKKRPPQARKKPSSTLWIAGAILGGALLILGIMLLSNQPGNYTPQVVGAPNMVLSQEVVDYGEVRVNTPVQAVFRVKNTGSEVLQLLDAEPRVELVEGC
jgi:hypothetical protein